MKYFRTWSLFMAIMGIATALTVPAAAKDHIKIGLSEVPAGLDFYGTSSRAALFWSYMIYDPLLERDPKTGELKPHLVKSWKTIDNLTWEFKLEEGVKFHNGNPFTAESVRYTVMDRILDPEKKSPQAGGFKWCKEIQIIDDYTFRVITEQPYPLVAQRFNVLFPLDPQWTEKVEAEHGSSYLARHTMGTGPFKLHKFVEGERLELIRNERYWKEGVPSYEKLTIRFLTESSTRMAELISGGVDAINYVSTDMVDMLKSKKNLKVLEVPILRIFFWQFDNIGKGGEGSAPLTDVRVRKAISHAIDRKAIVEHALAGHATLINIPINPLAFGADESYAVVEYDPEKAKALMKEAGYEDGFEVKAYVVGDEYRRATEAAQQYLDEINVKLNIQPFIGRYGEFAKIWKAGRADGITTMGWGSYNIFDADALWSYFFMSPEAPFNYTEDDELSKLLHDARETLQPYKRTYLYSQAQRKIVDNAYWLPFYARHEISAADARFVFELGVDQVPRWQYGHWKE